jgi:hypothetical protein
LRFYSIAGTFFQTTATIGGFIFRFIKLSLRERRRRRQLHGSAGPFDVSIWASQFTDVSGVTAKSTVSICARLKHRTALDKTDFFGKIG